MMRSILIALPLAFVLSCGAGEKRRSISPNASWVFLNAGPARSKKEMPEGAGKEMQSAHTANFGRLFDQGKLFTAGPLGDDGSIRGVVVLNTVSAEEVKGCFKTDPLVQNEMLEVEQHPWLVDVNSFGPPKSPFQMAEHTLCIVKKGKNWNLSGPEPTANAMAMMFPALEQKHRSGELISGPFLDLSEKLGVLLFASADRDQIRSEMERSPAFKNRMVELEFHPQFLAAGLFRSRNDSPPEPGKRAQLFDGKTFTGWEGDTQTWRIEKGAFIGGSLTEFVPHNDFICTTQQFKNFDLRLKVKLAGTGFVNGGVQFRSQRLKEPAFEMTGYQADMGEGWWGCLYDESRRNKVLAHTHAAIIKRIIKPDDWNDYIIRCEGAHIRLWLNGILTVDYTEPDAAIALSGLIGLQVHGGGKTEASYKDISVEELP